MTGGGPAQDTMVLALLLWQQAFALASTPQQPGHGDRGAHVGRAGGRLLAVSENAAGGQVPMTAVGRSRWMTFLLYGSITVLAVLWLVPMLSALATATLPLSQTRAGWWDLSPADADLRQLRPGLGRGAVPIRGQQLHHHHPGRGPDRVGRVAGRLRPDGLPLQGHDLFLLITTMIVPVQIILIPMLPWFRTLGLNAGPQEYLGIALVHTAFGAGWAIFMLGAFFAQIPEDLLEAARIDGAGWFDVFRRIALPLALPRDRLLRHHRLRLRLERPAPGPDPARPVPPAADRRAGQPPDPAPGSGGPGRGRHNHRPSCRRWCCSPR